MTELKPEIKAFGPELLICYQFWANLENAREAAENNIRASRNTPRQTVYEHALEHINGLINLLFPNGVA
jgi:hypothetical protein